MNPSVRRHDIGAAWVRAGGLVVLLLSGIGLTVAATRLQGMPDGLAPCWLACGLAVGPAVRWPWSRVLPVVAAALLVGCAMGGALNGRTAVICLFTAAQCSGVAWGLRRSLPQLMSDRRPLYRVRLAHLSRFLFAATLPTSLLAGALLALLDAVGGLRWPDAARVGAYHASATALSIALLAPLMWWDQLRAVSWLTTVAAVLSSLAVAVLAATDGRLFWLAPVVVILAGHLGSTWTALLSVACLAAGLLVQSRAEAIPAFDGPDGYLIWLLVVWRLLGAGLLSSLWSERRGKLHRKATGSGGLWVTAAAAWRQWRGMPHDDRQWLVVHLDDLTADATTPRPHGLAAGGSMRTRARLVELAERVRHGDFVVGVGDAGALLLVRLSDARVPEPTSLLTRWRAATHPGIVVYPFRLLPTASVAFLLASAAYLDLEPAESEDFMRAGRDRTPPATDTESGS